MVKREREPAAPKACTWCGSTNLDGPWGVVWFCDGCGRSVRAGDTPQAARQQEQQARRP